MFCSCTLSGTVAGTDAEVKPRHRYASVSAANAVPAKLTDSSLWGVFYSCVPTGMLQVCLITGGDSGIGRSVALMYAREGAEAIAISYLNEERDANVRH